MKLAETENLGRINVKILKNRFDNTHKQYRIFGMFIVGERILFKTLKGKNHINHPFFSVGY